MRSEISRFQFNRVKFTELVLYICSMCEPHRLGAVKLHKVLYFSDMFWFAVTGTPLTGSMYRKRPYGPTSDELLSILRQLSENGRIRIEDMNYFGYNKKVYIATDNVDVSHFSDQQTALVSDIIQFVCYNNTAKTISELSHDKAWQNVEFGAVIPYHSAYSLFPSIVSEETMEWAEKEVRALETETPGRSKVASAPVRDFRSWLAARRGETR
jgi:hypothetical protein